MSQGQQQGRTGHGSSRHRPVSSDKSLYGIIAGVGVAALIYSGYMPGVNPGSLQGIKSFVYPVVGGTIAGVAVSLLA